MFQHTKRKIVRTLVACLLVLILGAYINQNEKGESNESSN